MSTIDFAITINMSLNLKEEQASISIKNVELKPAILSLPIRLSIEDQPVMAGQAEKKTIHDIVLETAKKYVSGKRVNEFGAADLFHLALETYPDLKRNSFGANVIAAAPDHSSWKHYANTKDYLTYLGKGRYKLKDV